MKKLITFIITILLMSFTYAQSRKDIASLLKGTEGIDFYLYEYNSDVYQTDTLKLWSKCIVSPYKKSKLYFVDDVPLANWGHPCRYIFINIANRNEITVFDETAPPQELENFTLLTEIEIPEREVYTPEHFNQFESSNISLFRTPIDGVSSSYGKKYAVIISGGGNRNINYERYWNDCSAIFSTLKKIYKFEDSSIYPLISDGLDPAKDMLTLGGQYANSPTDLDGDGRVDVIGPATKSEISRLFTQLGSLITSQDFLYIFTTDHGDRKNNQSTLVLWNDEQMTAAEFATELNKVNAGKISIVMEQCYSGGFIEPLTKDQRVIATACKDTELSYVSSNRLYNEFVYHWTAAALGRYPNGTRANADYNGDGFVSMDEAFRYANTHDSQPETPQYKSSPNTFGNELTLFGFLVNETKKNITVSSSSTMYYYAYNLTASESGSSFIVNSGGKAYLKAGNRIILKPGFQAKTGSTFRATIEKFSIPVYSPSRTLEEIEIDSETENEFFTYISSETGELTTNVEVYPTTGKGVYYLIKNGGESTHELIFELFSMNGTLLMKEKITSNRWAIDIQEHAQGLYLLNVYQEGKLLTTKKLIKE